MDLIHETFRQHDDCSLDPSRAALDYFPLLEGVKKRFPVFPGFKFFSRVLRVFSGFSWF